MSGYHISNLRQHMNSASQLAEVANLYAKAVGQALELTIAGMYNTKESGERAALAYRRAMALAVGAYGRGD